MATNDEPASTNKVTIKAKNKKYLVWFGIFLIWPFYLLWWTWKRSKAGMPIKVLLTAVGGFSALVWLSTAFAIGGNPSTTATPSPKLQVTPIPSAAQVAIPSNTPTVSPAAQAATPTPTVSVTPKPTAAPTAAPTAKPTAAPTPVPTAAPTPAPTAVPVPAEYKSALNQATSYANTMNLSKQGVYDQLVSQYGGKFSAAAAQYGIDNVQADWNANALAQAKTYQNTMNLSPTAVHDQLTSQYGGKFTQSEADYALQHLND